MNTTEGNKLIAEFMFTCHLPSGKYILDNNNRVYAENMKFHSSWDWLMPVVEKIEGLNFGIKIYKNSCWVTNYPESNTCATSSKIKSVWLAVVEFIEWYNRNK